MTILLVFLVVNDLRGQEECSRTLQYSDQELCFPFIEGMVESYENEYVKILADNTEVSMNEVLAFYVNDTTHQQVPEILTQGIDDYFKIYATKSLRDQSQNLDGLKSAAEEIKVAFPVAGELNKNIEQIIREELKEINFELEIGKPSVLSHDWHQPNVHSSVLLVKYAQPGLGETTIAMCMNAMLLKERLIWMAYYRELTSEEILKDLASKNKKIINQISQANQ